MGGEDICVPIGLGSERKGKPQQVFCYRSGGEAGALHVEEQKERGRSVVCSPASLAGVALGLAEGVWWV